jgi:hypothetical protein
MYERRAAGVSMTRRAGEVSTGQYLETVTRRR